MAHAIAKHVPKLDVPGALTKLFSRAIKARKHAGKWLKSQHDYEDEEAEKNETHAHLLQFSQKLPRV